MSETHTDIRDDVREHYTKVAQGETGCCDSGNSCCSVSEQIGYSKEDLASLASRSAKDVAPGSWIWGYQHPSKTAK